MILTLKDVNVLEQIRQLVYDDKQNETSIFIEQYNRDIEEAIKEVEAGDYYTNEEAEELLLKWEKDQIIKLNGERKR